MGTAVYRDGTADAFPDAVPAGAAATAGDTLGGAVQVADRLPSRQGAEVLEHAREAFTQALQVAVTVSGVLVLAAAVMVVMLVRRARAPEERPAPTVTVIPCPEVPC